MFFQISCSIFFTTFSTDQIICWNGKILSGT